MLKNKHLEHLRSLEWVWYHYFLCIEKDLCEINIFYEYMGPSKRDKNRNNYDKLQILKVHSIYFHVSH